MLCGYTGVRAVGAKVVSALVCCVVEVSVLLASTSCTFTIGSPYSLPQTKL